MSEPRKQLTVPFAPRPWQRPLLDDRASRIVAVVHRRAGKSTALLWRGLKFAVTCKRTLPRAVHILPYAVQWTRTGLWDQLVQAAEAIPGCVVQRAQLSIRLPNGGTFVCGGADNQDTWRGGYADHVTIDEHDDTPPTMVPLVIEPMLADRDGVLVRSGTPKGRGLLQAAYDRARITPGHSSYLLDYRKTGALSPQAIERLRQEMSEEEFAQEMECSFSAPNSGSYYGKLMQEAEDEGRIGAVPYDPQLRVWTSWDLGIHDMTAIWFCQITVGGEWRMIDYIEDSGAALDHYVGLMRQRPYQYEMHLLPHDAQVKELGSGRSRTETLASMGVMPYRIVRQHSVADGINAVRMVLPRAWFDAERCAAGIRALRHYRREWNESAQTWRANPVHDWASHCFTGDTKVLTRHGTYQIECLPDNGEVLTPCGWKPYCNPRTTRRNAPLVAVTFSDGHMVRCTPDHMFLTASGWKSASDLQPNTVIQSTLTHSHSILVGAYIVCGLLSDISRAVAQDYIAMFGRLHSVRYLAAAMFITGTATSPTISCRISNASLPGTIFLKRGELLRRSSSARGITSPTWPVKKRLSGIDQTRGVSGMPGTSLSHWVASSGKGKLSLASSVASRFRRWLARAVSLTSIARVRARPLRIVSVIQRTETSDVWCLTVPEADCFSLANGAVVHNCADSARYMALGARDTYPAPPPPPPRDTWWQAYKQSEGGDVQGWRVA